MKKLLIALTIFAATLLGAACGPPPQLATVGKPAPTFTLLDRQGKTWDLAELRGQVVFINFWASWCPPCRNEMPSMQRLYTSMPADKFKMLAILYKDEAIKADAFIRDFGYTFPVLLDPDGSAGRAYGLTGVPETFIIDTEGVVREKFIGPVEWNTPAVRQTLEKYLPG